MRSFIFFILLYISHNLYSQEINTYLESGDLGTIYNHIKENCNNDSIAVMILADKYIIKGLKFDKEKLSQQKPADIVRYIEWNKRFYCVFKDYYYNANLLLIDNYTTK